MNYIIEGKASTDGETGYFTKTKREITVKLVPSAIYIEPYDDSASGHIRAYFDTNEWDVKKEGIIYTDKQFCKGVSSLLKPLGLKYYEDLFYSEQGMQGDDFVDFDMGEDLARELLAKGLATLEEG